jgi:hypothetical protein
MEVEVRFEAIDGGTRVTLEHRGWDKVLSNIAIQKHEIKRWGWANIPGCYKEWAFWGHLAVCKRNPQPGLRKHNK